VTAQQGMVMLMDSQPPDKEVEQNNDGGRHVDDRKGDV
jgi:hypothetical protein